MIAIKERIIKAYDETRYSNLLFDDQKWYRRPQTSFLVIFILLSFPMFFLFKPDYLPVNMSIWAILLILGFIVVLNPIFKKRIKNKLNIEVGKNILSHWKTLEYREYELTKFYSKLVENKILLEKYEDVKILPTYEELFEGESKRVLPKESLLLSGGIILLFILPVWNTATSIT